jgi:hypothetical protein
MINDQRMIQNPDTKLPDILPQKLPDILPHDN